MWSVPESTSDRVDWPVSDPPPWPARVRATLWWHRSTSAARELGPDGRTIPMTGGHDGGLPRFAGRPVSARSSPVRSCMRQGNGSGLCRGWRSPFIAVDSEPVGARWASPLATTQGSGRVRRRRAAEIHCNRRRMAGAFGYADALGRVWPIAGALGFAQPESGGGSGDRVGKADGIVPIRARERRGRGADPAGLVGCGHPSRRRDSGRKNDYGSGQASGNGGLTCEKRPRPPVSDRAALGRVGVKVRCRRPTGASRRVVARSDKKGWGPGLVRTPTGCSTAVSPDLFPGIVKYFRRGV